MNLETIQFKDVTAFELCDKEELSILSLFKKAVLQSVPPSEDKESWFNERFLPVQKKEEGWAGLAMSTDKNIFYFFALENNETIKAFKTNLKYNASSPLPDISYKEINSRYIANLLLKFNNPPKRR